jgi:hypothetical protein
VMAHEELNGFGKCTDMRTLLSVIGNAKIQTRYP